MTLPREAYWELSAAVASIAAVVVGMLGRGRAADPSAQRARLTGCALVAPGAIWATTQLIGRVVAGWEDARPPFDGLLLVGTAFGGLQLLRLVDDRWRLVARDRRLAFGLLLYGAAWALGLAGC